MANEVEAKYSNWQDCEGCIHEDKTLEDHPCDGCSRQNLVEDYYDNGEDDD